MRTADDYVKMYADFRNDLNMTDSIKLLVEVARKECIEECAKRASLLFHCGTTKENKSIPYFQSGADNIQPNRLSILSLIEELT